MKYELNLKKEGYTENNIRFWEILNYEVDEDLFEAIKEFVNKWEEDENKFGEPIKKD